MSEKAGGGALKTTFSGRAGMVVVAMMESLGKSGG
jgi:hypothetical protein